MQTCDGMSRAVEEKCGPNGLVSWYMMASFAYYHLGKSILTDARFDEIGRTLKDHWPSVAHHHKHFITEDDLSAGTLLLAAEGYPHRVRDGAMQLLKSIGLTPSAEDRTIANAEFLPPERLRNDVSLYDHGLGMSWQAHLDLAAKERAAPAIRVRTRPAPAPTPAPAGEVRVRTRTRPA